MTPYRLTFNVVSQDVGASVPEPTSMVLLGSGPLALVAHRRGQR
jgi:hypothetical protein